MTDPAVSDPVLRNYFDALLEPAQTHEIAVAADSAAWRLCKSGRLQLLLPAAALGQAIDCAAIAAAPAAWQHARIHHAGEQWCVAELARCIAPELPAPPVQSLIPVTGSGWMLAVPSHPQPFSLAADAIQWRPHRNSRAWLAGMSRDGRYMALDVHILIAQAAAIGRAGEDATP